MSFDSLLNQTLVIERTAAGSLDDYGQPSMTWAPLLTVPGLVRPKTVKEMALVSQEGAAIGDWTIYLEMADISEKDRVRLSPDDGRIFEVTGVRPAYNNHHLELDAMAIT